MKTPTSLQIVGLFIFLIIGTSISAQDLIIFKNGDETEVKILELSEEEVIYKRFDNLDGPKYTKRLSSIFMIKYANGTKEVFQLEPESKQEQRASEISKAKLGWRKTWITTTYYHDEKRISKSEFKDILSENDDAWAMYQRRWPSIIAGGFFNWVGNILLIFTLIDLGNGGMGLGTSLIGLISYLIGALFGRFQTNTISRAIEIYNGDL